MARSQGHDREFIDATVEQFRTDCLLADGSLLFSDDRRVWTVDHLSDLRRRLVDEYIGGTDRNFEEKLSEQLAGAPETSQLAAEVLVVYALFVSNALSTWRKRHLVEVALKAGGADFDDVDQDSDAWKALDQRIGNPGRRYNQKRPDELAYLIDVALAFKELEEDEQKELLLADEPWEFQSWLDGLDIRPAQQRHILLHLLWPDHYERTAAGHHKRSILRSYGAIVPEPPDDEDRHLLETRARLRELLDVSDEELDFYRPPVNEWLAGEPEDQEALRQKGQLVFYGPPGTSKTYDALRLAEAVIRSGATRAWGIAEYFEKRDDVPDLVASRIHRRQLHPAYSYEDFIGGLVLTEGGATTYERGSFTQLCDAIVKENETTTDKERIPHVLILDEMNRADLSRVLGEAFSGLERSQRDRPIELNGAPADEPLVIPSNLYLIGTMNLIDQSVEQLDFALRRRFLWRHLGFERDRLLEILEQEWGRRAEDGETAGFSWDQVAQDMTSLANSAQALNDEIATEELLGRQYEVGHTYFADVVPIIAAGLREGRRVILWRGGEARRPAEELEQFWSLALEPLIDEYLAGLDQHSREATLEKLREVFMQRREG